MDSRSLNQVIKIQQQSTVHDAEGQELDDWSNVATIWANIRHLNGLEVVKADALTSIVKASMRIRYRTDLNAGMRVSYNGKFYNIVAVLPDEDRREYVDLACEVING